MATKTAIKKVVTAVTSVGANLTSTFVEWVAGIADICNDTYGGDVVPKEDMTAILDGVEAESAWRGTTSAKVRRSEVQALINSYPILSQSCNAFKQQHGELRREHVLKIARLAPKAKNAKDCAAQAVTFFKARANGPSGRVATLGMGLGIIKRAGDPPKGLSKTKFNAFRRELAALCEQYGITY